VNTRSPQYSSMGRKKEIDRHHPVDVEARRGRPSFPRASRAVPTDILHSPARVVVTLADGLVCPRVVDWCERTADDRLQPSTARPEHRYDHRLREFVRCTVDVTVATDLGVPRSMARGWLGRGRPCYLTIAATGF
jgi:hypothetical protein